MIVEEHSKTGMGSATGGSLDPQNKTGGPVIGLDPQIFLKNIKILCENKRINNSFENSSLVVTVSKHFSKFSENFFHILRIILYFHIQGGPKVVGPFSLGYNFKVLITQSQNFKQR